MAQADQITVDGGSGADVRAGVNEVLAAAISLNGGDTPPPDPVASMPWWQETTPGLSVRASNNQAWLNLLNYDRVDPPGAQHNEAAGYKIGSLWATAGGDVYFHKGNGVWSEVGEGGGGGSGGGGGMFLNFLGVPRMIDDTAQVPLGINTTGVMRMIDDGT